MIHDSILSKSFRLFKANRRVLFMNLRHGGWEQRHELEPGAHLVRAGQGHKAVVDELLLVLVTAAVRGALLSPDTCPGTWHVISGHLSSSC